MNTAQFLAADPKVNAWVEASAGTGKTKVLTDRILNLLLQDFVPERILCLTFTKAAAAEMSNRLMNRLAHWVKASELELSRELRELLGEVPLSADLLKRARQLFFLVLDVSGGMKIQTIHGFCQSVLTRFPLEAGIPPHFGILDEVLAQELFLQAQQWVFNKSKPLVERALEIINPYMADQRFTSILKDCYDQRFRIEALLEKYDTLESYAEELLKFLEVDTLISKLETLLAVDLIDRLKAQFISSDVPFEDYVNQYLTQKKEIRKKLSEDQLPEAERIYRFMHSLSTLDLARSTVALLILFQEIILNYQDRKNQRGVLDYDDLIQRTQKLLNQPGIASWVLYKLDGGMDHLLIDEAQDTNAAQWDIILSLTTEFFTQNKSHRTIFAVGDSKQSIYSFQGANPKDFLKLKGYFANFTQSLGQDWRDVQLDLSFRSTPAILEVVDEVFAKEKNKQGLIFDKSEIAHQVYREHSLEHLPGLVEIWPLVEAEVESEIQTEKSWPLPNKRVERLSPQVLLAQYIGNNIEQWLASKGTLPSTHQVIQPRDILILVRKRSRLGHEIIKALKNRNIPVAGADRLILTDHIAVMDLLALAQFVLLPEDDLNLACVLRSPLIGMSEEDLFNLAYDRKQSLWSTLAQSACTNAQFESAHTWLKSCLSEADLSPVYEFYSWVLTEGEGRKRLLGRLGYEIEDALEEFLALCLTYDREHASSLQGFVHFMNHQPQEVKRDSSDTVYNQVRIMTIHGAKGLQAPIVILPDATEAGKQKWDPLLWDENFVMLRPTQAQDTDKTRLLKSKGLALALEEKRRLLYVALTRAQDRLYVGGWRDGKDLDEECWYRLIQDAVEKKSGSNRHYHGVFKHDHEFEPKLEDLVQGNRTLPSWALDRPMSTADIKPDTLKKKIFTSQATERGILIHRLFEFLPQIKGDQRFMVASQIIAKEGLILEEWEKDIQATLDILNDPHLHEIFGPHSLAEVPITGMIDSVPFQGRIDRLLVLEDTLTIVDYKTNQDFPKRLEDVPVAYLKQLEGYATALKSVYPNHKIRKLLLWTAGPYIQVIQ